MAATTQVDGAPDLIDLTMVPPPWQQKQRRWREWEGSSSSGAQG